MNRSAQLGLALALIAIGVSASQSYAANTVLHVTVNTTPLQGHPAGPFTIAVAMTDGGGLSDGNNTVTISDVDFGGGAGTGTASSFGGAVGDLETSVVLTDSATLNVFAEAFVPGDTLRFTLTATMNDDAGQIPDRVTFSILDSAGVPLPTLAPAADYLIGVDVARLAVAVDAHESDATRAPSVGPSIELSVPTVVTTPPPTPVVALKVNGDHPNPPVVTTTGPMTVSLTITPSTYSTSVSWYWALSVNGQVLWVTSSGIRSTPAPLLVSPPVVTTDVTLLDVTIPPGSTVVTGFFLVDTTGAVVASDVVVAARP